MHILPRGPKIFLSYGSSERSGAGSHSHVRSFAGSFSGWRRWSALTAETKRPISRQMTMTTTAAASEAMEMPMMIAGMMKKHMKRYVSANQRYLAVVSPRNLGGVDREAAHRPDHIVEEDARKVEEEVSVGHLQRE